MFPLSSQSRSFTPSGCGQKADALNARSIVFFDPENKGRSIIEANETPVFQHINRRQGIAVPLKKQSVTPSIPATFGAYQFIVFEAARLLPNAFAEKLRIRAQRPKAF